MSDKDAMPGLQVTDGSTEESDEATFVVCESDGLQLHLDRNLFQLVAVLLFMAIGAAVGAFLAKDFPGMGALAGAVVGMIAGTFLSGFILMVLPPPAVTVTLHQIRCRRRQLRRRYVACLVVFAALALTLVLSALIVWLFGIARQPFGGLLFLLGVGAFLGMRFGVAIVYLYPLRKWKCPRCGKRFGNEWSTSCAHCGLSMRVESEEIIE